MSDKVSEQGGFTVLVNRDSGEIRLDDRVGYSSATPWTATEVVPASQHDELRRLGGNLVTCVRIHRDYPNAPMWTNDLYAAADALHAYLNPDQGKGG